MDRRSVHPGVDGWKIWRSCLALEAGPVSDHEKVLFVVIASHHQELKVHDVGFAAC